MKKLLMIFSMMLLFIACKKEDNTPVKFSVDYSFAPYSSSIHPKDVNINYTEFYNKYIVGRILTPYSYNLTFTGTKGSVLTVNGAWKNNEFFTLPPDKYIISGKSYPIVSGINFSLGDTCYINITDTINIDKNTPKLLLKAKYDCYLILIDNTNVSSTSIMYSTTKRGSMKLTEHFYNTFVYSPLETNGYPFNLLVTKKDGLNSVININNYPYIFGNYYYYANIGDDYILPPMSN